MRHAAANTFFHTSEKETHAKTNGGHKSLERSPRFIDMDYENGFWGLQDSPGALRDREEGCYNGLSQTKERLKKELDPRIAKDAQHL